MTTFAALGDSITLGIGDPAPGRTWRGWAALLAEGMPEPRLHNLATAGARAADVERDQLPRALELRPDVASVIVGINDTLRASFDPPRFARAAEPSSPPPTRLAQAGWMATKGTAWVIRRSTDLVPYLVFMGIRELWAGGGPEPPPRRADDGSAGRTTVPS
jgi:lysophospholipase L1-like esterase